jgi:hypothetical protein
MRGTVFGVVTPFNPIEVYRRFGGPFYAEDLDITFIRNVPEYESLPPLYPCVHPNIIFVSVFTGVCVTFRCIWIHMYHVMTLTLLAFSMITVRARKGILERLYSVMFGLVTHSVSP